MNKDKICIGCGVKLQDENMTLEGYTSNIENDICSRCFKMKNYGEYEIVTKSNDEYIEILKEVDKTKDLVLYIVDALNIDEDITSIRQYISNNMILVLNKRDVLPKSVKDNKLISYIKELGLDFKDIIVVSCHKNYNIDELMAMIKKYKSSRYVYVVGNTNVGKSSLINKLIKNYSEYDGELTISPLPSTTLNKISIKLSDDLTIIDTPGIVDYSSFIHGIDFKLLKKITPKKEIKPRVYQIKDKGCLLIEDLVRIEYDTKVDNSMVIYIANNINISFAGKLNDKLKDMEYQEFNLNDEMDLVIPDLCFIKFRDKVDVRVYIKDNVVVKMRDNLI